MDTQAEYTQIINKYSNLVYIIIANRLQSVTGSGEIEECVSDVFYAYYKERQSGTEIENTKAYLCTLAKRKAIDVYRRNIRTQTDLIDNNTADKENIFSLEKTELREKLIDEINRLGKPNSIIVYRRYILGEKVNKIAEALSMKPTVVSKRLERSLKKLKVTLRKEDFYD